MNTNEYLHATYKKPQIHPALPEEFCEFAAQPIRRKATCKDGFAVSIQASYHHYCEPRKNGDIEYAEVELGFPSEADELIADYAEDPDDLTGTVYGCVPVSIVDELLSKHGGLCEIANVSEEA